MQKQQSELLLFRAACHAELRLGLTGRGVTRSREHSFGKPPAKQGCLHNGGFQVSEERASSRGPPRSRHPEALGGRRDNSGCREDDEAEKPDSYRVRFASSTCHVPAPKILLLSLRVSSLAGPTQAV